MSVLHPPRRRSSGIGWGTPTVVGTIMKRGTLQAKPDCIHNTR